MIILKNNVSLQKLEQHRNTIAFQKKHGKQLWNFLVCDILGASPATLKTKPVSLKHRWQLKRAMAAINRGMPLPLATGTIAFLTHRFRTRRGVFQPRVETEELVQKAISRWFPFSQLPPKRDKNGATERNSFTQNSFTKASPIVIDLCCGSGVMGISAMLGYSSSASRKRSANEEGGSAVRGIRGIAIDSNAKAVKLSRANARRLLPAQIASHYRAVKADIRSQSFASLLKKLIAQNCDSPTHSPLYILCNPPYIAEWERGELKTEVLKHDPHLALFSGQDGLDHYRCLAKIATQFLQKDDEMAIELGSSNAKQVVDIFCSQKSILKSKQKDNNSSDCADNKSSVLHIEIQPDLFGKQRFAFISLVSNKTISACQTETTDF